MSHKISSDGSDETNLTLSQNRANTVRSYLTNTCGVSNTQIKSTVGYGEDPNYLVYDANGKEDRNASRRERMAGSTYSRLTHPAPFSLPRSGSSSMIPATSNTIVLAPFFPTAQRSDPSPESLRLVT